ncbi:sigma-54-dependent transcriptional regulator [Bacteroides cellulosilyticus]|jgi:two-component system response regulator HydG|uniref:sigma-54-dependent transcriptional regulator n=1 Tax=Bacteroides cellulosilyticus TaxID=246787 RepID=UPI00321BD111
MGSILIVEDDRIYARTTANWLVRNSLDTRYVLSVDAAKTFLIENEVDLVLSDFRLGEENGVELLEWMKKEGYHVPFFIMTGYADIPGAVEAVKKGAENYLPKPVQTEKVLGIIQEALNRRKRGRNIGQTYYVGKSSLALRLQQHIRLVAPVDTLTVLIRGASGTGKEFVARQVHALSERAQAPFVAVDCGALPKELAASELFGHVKGAFTGATENKTGMFAAANHGTLFLDEVGNLSPEVQMLLLRALQEKRYRPVGGKEEVKADIRLVAATNEDLEKAIAEGRFREDLFHRLNEFPLQVPLLAECPEDIIPLAEFMLEAANRELDRNVKGFDRESQKRMKEYSWPGNIRELRIIVRRAVLLAKDDWITTGDVGLPAKGSQVKEYALNDERTERETIVKALEATGNDRKAAAKLLGISRSTLYMKLKKYRLA